MHTNGRSTALFWNADMIATITRYYPTTFNEELAGILGISLRTMIRKARQLGLTKDKTWLLNVWNERRQWAHSASKIKGYPGTFKPGKEIGKEYRSKKKVL